jgi:hypothetical protein
MTSYCHSGLHGELDYHDCPCYKKIPDVDEAIIEAEAWAENMEREKHV